MSERLVHYSEHCNMTDGVMSTPILTPILNLL